MPATGMGNAVVAVPLETHPLATTDLYQVFDTSDLPDGVVIIVTAEQDLLAKILTEQDGVAGLRYFGMTAGAKMVEVASAGNLK